jgi:hypothetical protein
MNRVGVVLSLLGAILIFVSANTLHWRAGAIDLNPLPDVEFRVGLLNMDICAGSLGPDAQAECQRADVGEAVLDGPRNSAGQAFVMISLITYIVSILAGLLLLGGTAAIWRSGLNQPARWMGFASGGYMLGALVTAMAWTGVDSSVGWSFYVALAGGFTGIIGSGYLIIPEDDVGDQELARALATLKPSSQIGPTGGYGGEPMRPVGSPSGAAGEGAPTREAYRLTLDRREMATSAETAATMLRFVIREFSLTPAGVDAVRQAGNRRVSVAWSDLTRVEAYQLPVDPPFEGRTFVDLLPAGGAPLRFVATSRGNYGALPGGPGSTSLDSLRALAAHAVDAAGLTPGETLQEFLSGRKPRRMMAVKQLAAYDASVQSG